MPNIDLQYILNGLINLMIGFLAGFPFAKAIKNKTGREVAWRVVHSGGSAAGVMLIAIGAIINRLEIGETLNKILCAGLIISTYLLVAGMVLAAKTGERGIGNDAASKNSNWKIINYLYAIGAFGSVASLGGLIFCCLYLLKGYL